MRRSWADWTVGAQILGPGPQGSFDDIAVKDPSIVYWSGSRHLFYTAVGREGASTGYVSAPGVEELQAAPRHQLSQIRGRRSRYACAPQVFFFRPQSTWYLICQTEDAGYQPVYSTTRSIDDPTSWADPRPLVAKQDAAKWIDFWIICDAATAYLFYTRAHEDVYVMTTDVDRFPVGFSDPRRVFGPVHEAVHVYAASGLDEYHMLYETRRCDDRRRYGLAIAGSPLGPWRDVTRDFASGDKLRHPSASDRWTDEVSHGEMIRSGCDERLEYDPARIRFLIQGLPADDHAGPYQALPWRLGIIEAC